MDIFILINIVNLILQISIDRGASETKTQAFRESYCRLSELRSLFTKHVPFVVLTATALPEVEKEIVLNLQLRSVLHLSTTPDRRNLRYSVIKVGTEDPSITFHWLVKEIKDKGTLCGRVIIFCRTHRHCREIYRMFDSQFKETYADYKSRPYAMFHAGTEEEVKSYVVNSMTDINGTVRVLVATTAFGMGVD